jgi:hypothetical protein
MAALPATLPVSLEVPLDGEQGALPPSSGRNYCSMPRSPTCAPAHKEYAMTQTQRLDVRELINRNPLSRFQKQIIFLGFCVIALDGFDIAIMGFIAPTLKLEWG